ncbi:hypothetical protein FOZ63_031790 [Perkinsus olseni]|uniref:Peptidase A1 domain-containing protein n=1 Tax=Perkinsus olseni TaxID=32597 RepID=A0A7J6QBN1_PEROL|nr:hypothetical protein FOZ63_031790 [Perkinsus olseni]
MPSTVNALKIFLLGTIIRSLAVPLRLPIYRQEFGDWDSVIVAPMKADGQSLSLLVDTGSSEVFFVEKKYLERAFSPGACEDFLFGCYECPAGPCRGEVSRIEHCDDTCAYTVQHRGTVEFGGRVTPDVDFGLVVGYTPNDSTPHASLGLAPRDDGGPTPLIDQLIDKGVINRPDFSIYFKPDNPNEGELILGGEDPSKYRGPMMIVPLARRDTWTVKLARVEVGGRSVIESIPMDIDSGTSYLWLPLGLYTILRMALEKSASEAAGRNIKLRFDGRVLALRNCSDRDYLPPLEMHFLDKVGGVSTIVIPPELYVQTSSSSQSRACILLWQMELLQTRDRPTLGLNLLRKYYLHFRHSEREIRFAEAARTHEPMKAATNDQKRRRRMSSWTALDLASLSIS